jgi:hypothetical protein
VIIKVENGMFKESEGDWGAGNEWRLIQKTSTE